MTYDQNSNSQIAANIQFSFKFLSQKLQTGIWRRSDYMKKNKDIVSVLVGIAAILMIPLVAMQFTNDVSWDLTDFIIMGILLVGTGMLVVLASRKIKNINHKVVVIIAILAALLLVWAHLAVGLFDSLPFAGS